MAGFFIGSAVVFWRGRVTPASGEIVGVINKEESGRCS